MDQWDIPEDPSAEFLPADPLYRRLHRGVRFDPESVWEELRTFLCDSKRHTADLDAGDLIEDLMFRHADAFLGRIEALVVDCPSTREIVAWAYVGGVTGDGVDGFHDLQQRLQTELEAETAKPRRLRSAVLGGLIVAALAVGARALRRRR